MNREIKFRVWDLRTSEWIFNLGMKPDNILSDGQEKILSIMQYTGLKDKNGKEIYEGDIVRILYTDWISNTDSSISLENYKKSISQIGKVEYFGDGFIINFGVRKYWDEDRGSLFEGKHGEKEVIGNIFENPELLNKQ